MVLLPQLIAVAFFMVIPGPRDGEDPAVPVLRAEDSSHGAGGVITLKVGVPEGRRAPTAVILERSAVKDGPFEEIARLTGGVARFEDGRGIEDGERYYYRARFVDAGMDFVLPVLGSWSAVIGPISSEALWFEPGSEVTLAMCLLVIGIMVFFLFRARSGKAMYIRPIPGLKAVEEAIGRATEMGKPVLYCSGVADIRCPGVLASLTVLGWVSEQIARYGCGLTYPVNNPLTLTAGQEIVKESFMRAGKPELYHDDLVYFISGEQFAYAAAVCGVMERERPAANFFFGSFWSETLILTESGAATGAMQIAATDTEHQIPFLVATCDYVIIGEEFYAASAYLSQDANIKGSLKAQDWIKAVLVLLILAGVILATLEGFAGLDMDWFFSFFRS